MKPKVDMKEFPWHSLVFVLSTVAMIGLGVFGFIVPPLGEIHPSVFQYSSLLCVPLTLSQLPFVLREVRNFKGFKTTFSHGNTKVEIDAHRKAKPADEQ